ncbi:hypothetical protein NP603_08075 [Methylomonas sp. SURF-1]|uniref:Ice-binding protein C-terminal domain-containing protein n=1 Tax=Methylomonas aurea TaxID=2952224 RepID=A0ABT1UGA3_9GAMM|nr:PEP-CTERM sorting domain-containing protein [Methylomonas sp. SURF-1]MCQ8181061.1 hypothetical protein [Methylomonas sp. SURF-1]
MMKYAFSAALAAVLSAPAPAQANTLVVDGTLFRQAAGTTFDVWNIAMQTAGSFSVDLVAYEASQNNVATAGYATADLNGDGELTWLDPDTHWYQDDGSAGLSAANHLARCDDIANNCATVSTGTISLTTRSQEQGAADGSIHFRRDPAFDIALAAGAYRYVIADYRLTDAEAAAGINSGDSFSAPGGYANPILDYADYRITFSSDTLNFALSGNTITVSQVPLPGTVWLFGSVVAGWSLSARRKAATA